MKQSLFTCAVALACATSLGASAAPDAQSWRPPAPLSRR